MKTLQLNIPERLAALSVFNNPESKVPTENLKIYLDDVDKFRLSDEDKVAVKWEEIKSENGDTIHYKWDQTGVEPKSIEINEFTRKFLEGKLQKLEVGVSDSLASAIVSLVEKIK